MRHRIEPVGRKILKGHAVFLLVLTPLLTLGTYVGYFTGRGPYGGLSDNPMAISGLAQAYPLMGLVALGLWFGSFSTSPARYSFIAIAAHCIPLATLAILWGPISSSAIAPALPFSFIIHFGGIAAEIVSLRIGYRHSPKLHRGSEGQSS